MAVDDHDAVVRLTQQLVRIPSRGGIDSYDPVLEHLRSWLGQQGLNARRLLDSKGMTVALVCEVVGAFAGPHYVLDACLDTAPFGDESAWTYPPASGRIADGWLHGRGSADSKAGAAIFAHIASRLHSVSSRLHGQVTVLYDVDEHTGAFGGAKSFFSGPDAPHHVDGVLIGYPGLEHVVIGGRGVLRADLRLHGVASHSGGSTTTPNAIVKAAALIQALHDAGLPGAGSPVFPPPAKLTITAITGGEGYSTVPDLCVVNVDVRLTPTWDDQAAEEMLRTCVRAVDAVWPTTAPTQVEITTRWPAYRLADDSPMKTVLLASARAAGLATTAKIAGPSNIGNYLAGLGIEATAGFGVDYVGLHGTDERIRIATIPQVQAVYHQALLALLRPA
ncbi:M20 family metallopeptidase [Streptosporangium canum]|uniref:M20 family metallopeptidase n=1 Tax=Streptosporangium canum TaxID=324952 RepID=UPI0036B30BE6